MKAKTPTKRKHPEDVQPRTPQEGYPKKRPKAARKSATRASDPRPSTSQTRLDNASRVPKEKPRPGSSTQPNAVASSSKPSTSLKRKISQISSTQKTTSSSQFFPRKWYLESSDSDSDKTPPPGILQYLSPRSKLAQNGKYPTPKGRKLGSPSKPKEVHIGSIEISSDSGEEMRRPPTKRIKTKHGRENAQDVIDLCSDDGEANPTPEKFNVRTRIEGDIINILTTDEESELPPPPAMDEDIPSTRYDDFSRAITPLGLGPPNTPPASFPGNDLLINTPTRRDTRSHVVEPGSGKSCTPPAAVIKDHPPANVPPPGLSYDDKSSDPVKIYKGGNKDGYGHTRILLDDVTATLAEGERSSLVGVPGHVEQDTLSSSAPKSPRKVAQTPDRRLSHLLDVHSPPGLDEEDSSNRLSQFETDANSIPAQPSTSDSLTPHTRKNPQKFPDKDPPTDKTSEVLPLPQLQCLHNGLLENPSFNAAVVYDPVSGSPFTSKDLITKALSIHYTSETHLPTLLTPLFFLRHQTQPKRSSQASNARPRSPSPRPAPCPEPRLEGTLDESSAWQVEVPLPGVDVADKPPATLVVIAPSPPPTLEISNENTANALSTGQTRTPSPLAPGSGEPSLQPAPPLALSEIPNADTAQAQFSPTISEERYEDPIDEPPVTPPRILSPSRPIYEEPDDATVDEILAAQAQLPSLFPPKSEEPNTDFVDEVSATPVTNILSGGLAEVYEEDLIESQLLVQLLMDTDDEMSVCDANDDPAPPISISSPTSPPELDIPAETDPPPPISGTVADSAMMEAHDPSTSPDLQNHSHHSRSPITRRETSQSPATSEDSAFPVTPAPTMEEPAPRIESPSSVAPDLSFFEGDLSVQISTYIKNVMEEDDDDDDDISLSGLEFAYPDVPLS